MGDKKFLNAKIYKIVDVGYNKCYIGSTCESLSQRMARHRDKYRWGKDRGRTANLIFDEYGIDNCKIELIEDFCCSKREELLRREGQHIQNNDCVNKIVSGRTPKEYREENIKHIKEQKTNYYNDNQQYLNYQKQIYRELNKDKIKQISKDYYERKKADLSEKQMCQCGKIFTTQHFKRHEKSQKHQNYLKQKLENEWTTPCPSFDKIILFCMYDIILFVFDFRGATIYFL